MDERIVQLIAYFKQQEELDTPPYIFSDSFSWPSAPADLRRRDENAPRAFPTAVASTSVRSPDGTTGSKPAATPLPVHKFMRSGIGALAAGSSPAPSPKRKKLADLFRETKTCQRCQLGKLRKSFVFGTGNPDALFMIIGEAPGEEEDRQGLPFVGAAGELLTKMLAAIQIDRKKHAFITNIVKCRPPDNRNPEAGEILACSDMIARQIDIIGPKALLLLGRVAAHALLGSTDSVADLRKRNGSLFHKNIPAFVTYHPAALLRNDAYRRPAWEDLQKLQTILTDAGVYDVPA